MARVVFDHVTKRFGDVVAVRDLDLEARDHEFLVLLGPSGCGKSTALRMVAGLEDPSDGDIRIGDRVVNDIEPKDRDIAMVFQSYALYPHMTVARNIEFPLKSRKLAAAEREKLVAAAADALGLGELMQRKPAQLSGGQRQRVALARAIVRRPQAFLMDEPLSNLDATLRVQTRAELIELQRRLETTVIYVTHDQVEAMTMGHRIAIMRDGVLQQVGPPQEVYDAPANLFVASFIGTPPMNTVPGKVVSSGDGAPAVSLPGAEVALPADLAARLGERNVSDVVVGVRPEHVLLRADGVLPAEVVVVESLGHERHVICRLLDGTMVITRQPADDAAPAPGTNVRLAAEAARFHVFDADSGSASGRHEVEAVLAAGTREALLGYALVLPSLIVFGGFVFYPFIKNIWLGFYRSPPSPLLPRKWAGFEQYHDVLTSESFRNSLKVTFEFAFLTVPLGLVLGLGLAVLAHQKLRGAAIYRTIFSSTVATSVAVAAVIFFTLLNPQIGLIPYWLGSSINPLQDPKWALISVSATTVWQSLGLSFILMSAGLQSVPDDLLEAARVDGAGTWSRFRNVMLPMLSPTLFFAAIVGTIFAFQAFGQIDILTRGGPSNHTNVLVYAIYRAVFVGSPPDQSRAAVLSVALFAITLVLTLIQLRFLERRVTYER